MIARIQLLLLDGILAANTLPRHFEFERTRTAQADVSMLDLHWTDVSGAARHELRTWCAAAMIATCRRYLEGWQALTRRESEVDAAWLIPNAPIRCIAKRARHDEAD